MTIQGGIHTVYLKFSPFNQTKKDERSLNPPENRVNSNL